MTANSKIYEPSPQKPQVKPKTLLTQVLPFHLSLKSCQSRQWVKKVPPSDHSTTQKCTSEKHKYPLAQYKIRTSLTVLFYPIEASVRQ